MKRRKWKRWAVVSPSGLCTRSMRGAAAIYDSEYQALTDIGAKNQRVERVEVRELPRKVRK